MKIKIKHFLVNDTKLIQKTKLIELTTNSNSIFDDLTQMLARHLSLHQSTEIKTPNLQLNFQKSNVSSIQNSLSIQDSDVKLPAMCDLLSKTDSDCKKSIVYQKVI